MNKSKRTGKCLFCKGTGRDEPLDCGYCGGTGSTFECDGCEEKDCATCNLDGLDLSDIITPGEQT